MTYYYETIEELEKQIISKSIDLDITYSSNVSLFECFIRTIRTIIVWSSLVIIPITLNASGGLSVLKVFGILILIHIIGSLLISWVKYNHHRSYINMKHTLIDNMISRCKEWQESEYEEWQKKQMIKRFADLAYLNIDIE